MARYTETIYPVRILLPLTAEMAERARDYRFAQRIESQNEAIRQLIEAGLSAGKPSAPSGGSDPGGASKPDSTDKSATPAQRTPGRHAEPEPPQSKEAQIRALREQGGRQ
jgi:hypothetical protein